MQADPKKSQNSSRTLALILLLTAGFLFVYSEHYLKEEALKKEELSEVKSDARAEVMVNKFLQETNRKIEAQKMKSAVENAYVAPIVGQLVPQKKDENKPLAVEAPEDYDQQVIRRKLAPDVSSDDSSPRSEVEMQLAEKQRLEQYNREYTEKYIQEFVSNARKNGWSIKVNKEGVITEAHPIPGFDPEAEKNPKNIFSPVISGSGE